MTLEERLGRIEQMLAALMEREPVMDWYSTDEFAQAVGKAEFTVREWCRLGRIHARRRGSGRGPYRNWAISHEELRRYRRDGLLPTSASRRGEG
jgi:predicted site-specific integrase-resolvase